MDSLASKGIVVERTFITKPSVVSGMDAAIDYAGGSEMTELVLTLPRSTSLQATFTQEGLTHKLVKIFKKEIQAGEPTFDALVYISTDTTAATTKLVSSSDVRAIIARVVSRGGFVELDGVSVKLLIPGHDETEDADTIALADILLAFAPPD